MEQGSTIDLFNDVASVFCVAWPDACHRPCPSVVQPDDDLVSIEVISEPAGRLKGDSQKVCIGQDSLRFALIQILDMLFTSGIAVSLLLAVFGVSAGPILETRDAVSTLSSAQISSYKPYTYYAATGYCTPATTLAWNCGSECLS